MVADIKFVLIYPCARIVDESMAPLNRSAVLAVVLSPLTQILIPHVFIAFGSFVSFHLFVPFRSVPFRSTFIPFGDMTQHVSKMDHFQKNCAINTLEASAKVLPLLLRDGRLDFVETVVLLLDHSKPLYCGSKTMWTSLPGAPEVHDTRLLNVSCVSLIVRVLIMFIPRSNSSSTDVITAYLILNICRSRYSQVYLMGEVLHSI